MQLKEPPLDAEARASLPQTLVCPRVGKPRRDGETGLLIRPARTIGAVVAGVLWLDSARAQTTNLCDGCTFSGSVTNPLGSVTELVGTNAATLDRGSTFDNLGLVLLTGSGSLNMGQGARFENLASGTYDLESDAGFSSGYPPPEYFDNFGTFRKSDGAGSSVVSPIWFNNLGGVVDVETGTLTLAYGSSSNGVFTVASGAVLDLTGGATPTWAGVIEGSGAGEVALSSGTLTASPSLTLNCATGLIQWNGGAFSGTVTNANVVTISGAVSVRLLKASTFSNAGLVRHLGNGGLNLGQYAHFENLSSGAYDLESDAGFFTSEAPPQHFDNFGTFRKSGGTSNSVVSKVLFDNLGGVVDVETGTLTLANSGSSSNGLFTVGSGATLDLTGGAAPTWAGVIEGSGAGEVALSSGTLTASPSLTLNCAAGLFQWSGGILSGTLTNANTMTISGAAGVRLEKGSSFNNTGLVRHVGNGGLSLAQYAHFENLSSGTYDLESDAGLSGSVAPPQYFDNFGTLGKSGGTNVSTIAISFNNQNGSIEVDSGTLSLAGNPYVQGTGALTIKLGGAEAGESGQLVTSANASLGGPLNVELANHFVPALGSRFLILSCARLTGTFTSASLPPGISVNYLSNGVLLVAIGGSGAKPSAATDVSFSFPLANGPSYTIHTSTNGVGYTVVPELSGPNFTFSFPTLSGTNAIQMNDDLGTTNWIDYTNFVAQGLPYQFLISPTNPQEFFRIRQP